MLIAAYKNSPRNVNIGTHLGQDFSDGLGMTLVAVDSAEVEAPCAGRHRAKASTA
jgi:hypothetical protein